MQGRALRLVPAALLAVTAAGLFWLLQVQRPGPAALDRLAGYATTCGVGLGPAPEGAAPPGELGELGEAVRSFWLAYAEAMETLDPAPLAAVTEGGARPALRRQVEARRAADRPLRLAGFEHVPLLRGREGDAAWVRDAVKLVAESGGGGTEASFLLVDLLLRAGPGGWAVAGFHEAAAEPAAEGRCPLSADLAPYTERFDGVAPACEVPGSGGHRFAALEPALRLGVRQEPLPDGELAAIERAVRCYWTVSGLAYEALDVSGLERVAGGDLLPWLRESILARRRDGRVLREEVEHRQLFLLQYTGDHAVVDDWALVRAAERDAATGEVVREAPPERMLLSMALEKDGGQWRVVGLTRVGRHGDAGAPGPGAGAPEDGE